MRLVRIGAAFITLAAVLISLSGCHNLSLGGVGSAAIPTGLSLAPGNGTITVTWTPVANATSYNILWSTVSGLNSGNTTEILSASNPYTVTGLNNGTLYYVAVTAVTPSGESLPSAIASATPVLPVPTGVTATPVNGQMTIAWVAVPGASSYNVYWSAAAGFTPNSGTKITGAGNPLVLTGLGNGTTYYALVTAVFDNGESAASSQVSATPTSGILPPTGVTATPGNGQMTIAWIAVPGASSYNVYWSATAGVTPSSGTKITGASNPLVLAGLTNGTTYYAVVTAVAGNAESAASSQVSATPPEGGAVVFTDYPGNWAGSWHNNTFGSSGPATLAVALDSTGTKMTWTIAVQGNVFGGAAPPPETFIGTVAASGITLSGTSVSFGQLLLNIDPNGVVTGSGTNVNSPTVSGFIFSGTWTKGGFSLTYTALLTAGGTATGTFLMNKQ